MILISNVYANCQPKTEGGMGFRHLHDFNMSVLGKQGWRLLTKPENLVAKVYKARYYPNCSFLSATLGVVQVMFGDAFWSLKVLLN